MATCTLLLLSKRQGNTIRMRYTYIYIPPEVDRMWGIWGSYYICPKPHYLLKGDYKLGLAPTDVIQVDCRYRSLGLTSTAGEKNLLRCQVHFQILLRD